jgi:hypothetical protein
MQAAIKKWSLGSSETTREAPFNFNNYNKYSPSHIKKINPSFLEWFIGFAEGDGSFCVNKMHLSFEIVQKDPKVLFLIKKTLGFGRVRKWTCSETDISYWIYHVDNKANIQRIISLFNGNLVLPKRRFQLNTWIKAAEETNCLPADFENKQTDIFAGVEVSLKSAWLSGFIDAEGCFYACLSTPAPGLRLPLIIHQKMHITQKAVYGEEKILEKIGLLFLSKAKVKRVLSSAKKKNVAWQSPYCAKGLFASHRKQEATHKQEQHTENFFAKNLSEATLEVQLMVNSKKQKSPYFRIEISALESHKKICVYLSTFKLKTNKYIASKRWTRVVMARERKDHIDPLKLPKLFRLCKAINNT